MDEDFTQFAYTKPSTILIQDEEFTVNAWAELLPIVCNSFLQDDKDVFREIAHEGTISAFAISDEDHSYAENMAYEHIDQDVYIRTAMSAYSTLNTISKLVNSFDEKADTDYKDNVMFTLR